MRKQYIEQPVKGIWTRSVPISTERSKPSSHSMSQMTRQGNAALTVSPNIRFNSVKKK